MDRVNKIYNKYGVLGTIGKAVNVISKKSERIYGVMRLKVAPPLPEWHKSYEIDGVRAFFRVSTQEELNRILGTSIEDEVIKDLMSEVRPSDVFYDIGANIGVYSRFVCERLKGGEVIAFEPLAGNSSSFRKNLSRTPVQFRLFELGLSDEDAEHEFLTSGEGEAGQGMSRLQPTENDSPSGLTIQTVKGDEFIESHDLPRPNVIKIDVEGAELKVLNGLRKTIAHPECRVIYCEIHHDSREGPDTSPDIADYGGSPEELKETLREGGYSITRLANRNTPVPKGHIIKAEK